jgi:hypothetical protein
MSEYTEPGQTMERDFLKLLTICKFSTTKRAGTEPKAISLTQYMMAALSSILNVRPVTLLEKLTILLRTTPGRSDAPYDNRRGLRKMDNETMKKRKNTPNKNPYNRVRGHAVYAWSGEQRMHTSFTIV